MRSPAHRPWWRRGFPGVFITSPGGGGASTVTTDGVTITGTGSAGSPIALLAAKTDTSLQGAGTVASPLGILSVGKNSTLTGAGTAGTPLGVNGWPLIAFNNSQYSNSFHVGGTNQVSIWGFVLAYPLTFANITIDIATADAVNSYDIGLYTKAGALVANIGAQTIPSTGIHAFATVQGSQTIAPGLYLFGATGNANTAQIEGSTAAPNWVVNTNVTSSSGGALPSSIGAIAASPGINQVGFSLS